MVAWRLVVGSRSPETICGPLGLHACVFFKLKSRQLLLMGHIAVRFWSYLFGRRGFVVVVGGGSGAGGAGAARRRVSWLGCGTHSPGGASYKKIWHVVSEGPTRRPGLSPFRTPQLIVHPDISPTHAHTLPPHTHLPPLPCRRTAPSWMRWR